jgi:ubiquitin-conjugating enzyme E2 H
MTSISDKRKKKDIQKLIKANPTTKIIVPNQEVSFKLIGPDDTCYKGSIFELRVFLPNNYPFKSPSIAFNTKIFHPNIDARSGAICLNVINQTWSPTYSLINIWEIFIPQLMAYPNPDDPLNREAAILYKTNRRVFASRAKEYIIKYCERNEDVEGDINEDDDIEY